MNTIAANAWNRLIDFLRRNQILGCTLLKSGNWKHPWQVTPSWDAANQRWVAGIHPGFVNGLDAAVTVVLEDAPQDTKDRIKRQGIAAADSVDAWLTEEPLLPLMQWRAIGADATMQSASLSDDGSLTTSFEPVPEFLSALGVGEPPNISSETTDAGLVQRISGELEQASGKRLLRACDLALYHDRFATSTQWTQGVGIDGMFVQFNVTYQIPPTMRERAYIRASSNFEMLASTPLQDRLKGDWTDTTFDALHLATVYLLSPENAALESAPDQTWTPYVKHRLFWNLNYASNVLEPALKHENMVFNTGLAAGLLDTIANQILATINDQNAAIAEFLNRNTLEGRFWST